MPAHGSARRSAAAFWRTFARSERGTITILGALALPVTIGVAALAVEYGNGLLGKVENQRVADSAAFAGALAYGSAGTADAMTKAALNVAALNGIAAADIDVRLIASPRTAGSKAVAVTVSTTTDLVLSRILSTTPSIEITASASAQVGTSSEKPACITALHAGQSGISLSGGTKLTAKDCTVASNASVTVANCSNTITAPEIDYNSAAAPAPSCNNFKAPDGGAAKLVKKAATDPFAAHAGVLSATGRMTTVAAMAGPAAASMPAGADIEFAYNDWDTTASGPKAKVAAAGCTAAKVDSVWTVTCPGTGPYTFGTITIGGGLTLNFNKTGNPLATYNFRGAIRNSGGSTMTFGPGAYKIAGGIDNTGAAMSIGAGSTQNSFWIGPGSNGKAINAGNGTTMLGDTTGLSGSVFKLVGNVASTGGTCLSLSAAAEHDIQGSMSISGGVILGPGSYTLDGYFAAGENQGGTVSCWGASVGVKGEGVTLVLSGKTKAGSGACNGQVFCVAAGYNGIRLTAPTSGSNKNLIVLGPKSASNTGGALLTQGGSDARVSGTFYFPNGPLKMDGGASLGGGTTGCLQIVASHVMLLDGTAATSDCVGATSSAGAGKVSLVQ